MPLKSLRILTTLALILAWMVVMLGAYTRLTDAGLGCPDWPGCYGHMIAPMHSLKAWTEMVHRYAAGSLAILIFAIGLGVSRYRLLGNYLPWALPLLLVILVVFQALLGMWTVTLKLLPLVVMGHLLGGMLIFASLCYFRMQISQITRQNQSIFRFWIGVGIALVFCQIALGGWVSSNYAGIACIGFPRCNGAWWPNLHFFQGFHLFSPVGANYQGGLLDNEARVTIQFIHRIGALIVTSYVLILAVIVGLCTKTRALRYAAMAVLLFVLLQLTLGIANVIYLLPLWVAVLHNGVAALLFASMVILHYLATGDVRNAR